MQFLAEVSLHLHELPGTGRQQTTSLQRLDKGTRVHHAEDIGFISAAGKGKVAGFSVIRLAM
jgi:hypothetical protein